jgi:hypothetical protein
MLINETIYISKKPGIIWNYLMDVSNDVDWRNGITKAEWTSPPPYGLGSTGEHTHKDMGILTWRITSFHDGSSFEFLHTSGGLKGSIANFRVEPEDNGSRIRVQMRVTGSPIMRLMLFLMGDTMRKGVQGDLQKLMELLDKHDTDT